MSDRRIAVDYLARMEGDGGIDIVIGENGEIKNARWNVWEPPRFFEAFLIGRRPEEVPELVQRICGICPHAHQLAAIKALERAMEIKVSDQTWMLRDLFHAFDFIMSHALHIYCLASPRLRRLRERLRHGRQPGPAPDRRQGAGAEEAWQ